jgi:hypothetical protein
MQSFSLPFSSFILPPSSLLTRSQWSYFPRHDVSFLHHHVIPFNIFSNLTMAPNPEHHDDHEKAAYHYEEAAKHQRLAHKHHLENNAEMAAYHAYTAQGHHYQAEYHAAAANRHHASRHSG